MSPDPETLKYQGYPWISRISHRCRHWGQQTITRKIQHNLIDHVKTSVITLLIVFLSLLSLKNFNRIEDCYSFSRGSLHFFTMKLLRGISFLTLLGKSFWALTWSVTIKDYKKLIAIYIIDVDICCCNDHVVDRKNPTQNVPRNQNYISLVDKIVHTWSVIL